MRNSYFKKNSKKRLVLIIVLVLIISAGIIVGFIYFIGDGIELGTNNLNSGKEIIDDNTEVDRLVEDQSGGLSAQALEIEDLSLKDNLTFSETSIKKEQGKNKEKLFLYEMNNIILPSYINPDTCVDVRIYYPDGTNYIVLSGKYPIRINEDTNSCVLALSEEELCIYLSALNDLTDIKGSSLFITRYIEDKDYSVVNYTPSLNVIGLINNNPNINEISSNYLQAKVRKSIEEMLLAEEGAGDNSSGLSEEDAGDNLSGLSAEDNAKSESSQGKENSNKSNKMNSPVENEANKVEYDFDDDW